MENLRLLSNMETPKHKLVQILLSGQPELESKLDLPELRQLAQRISIRKYIEPLKEKETYEYIRHRLEVAKYKGPGLFSPGSKGLIWQYCGGVPRKINAEGCPERSIFCAITRC
jgi:type II secretory pathway predicted ATPase ExeA